MTVWKYLDTPIPWAIAGFVIGFALGVNSASVWLMAAGLGGFVAYLWAHGPAQRETEGWLFAAGPVYMLAWIVGFIVRGIAL